MLRSLYVRLLLAFTLVVGVGIAIAAIVASVTAGHELNTFVRTTDSAYVDDLARKLEDFYRSTGSWSEVGSVFAALPPVAGRLQLQDAGGTVIAQSSPASGAGRANAGQGRRGQGPGDASGASTRTVPLFVDGQQVGTLLATGGLGASVAASATDRFNERVRLALVIGGIAALVAALALAMLFALSITRPLRRLRDVTRRVANGDYSQRASVGGPSETADLGASFNQMAEALESGQQQRRQLLADIVHELRTPLSVIQGTAQGFIDGVIPADERHAAVIRDESALLGKIVADLRDLSLAETGELRLETKPVDLADLAERATGAIRQRAAEQKVKLELVLEEDLPPALVDPDRTLQILSNLLDNAVRHTPEGGQITLSVSQDGPTRLLAEVRDSGEGIATEHLPHIFDRFYRVDPSRSRRGGTGLGLAIVRQLARAQGGDVTVESEPGRGSCFRVTFRVSL